MRFDWDPAKDVANQAKHGFRLAEATPLFTSGVGYLELYDVEHSSDVQERFFAIGPVARGIIAVVWTELPAGPIRIISVRAATRREAETYRAHFGGKP